MIFRYQGATLWRYMDKYRVKGESKAFQLVSRWFYELKLKGNKPCLNDSCRSCSLLIPSNESQLNRPCKIPISKKILNHTRSVYFGYYTQCFGWNPISSWKRMLVANCGQNGSTHQDGLFPIAPNLPSSVTFICHISLVL